MERLWSDAEEAHGWPNLALTPAALRDRFIFIGIVARVAG
jgi:hypothetical protein